MEINIDGTRYLAMPTTPPPGNFSDYLGISWESQLYSYNDILAGGTPTLGEFAALVTEAATTTQYYSMVSGFFLNLDFSDFMTVAELGWEGSPGPEAGSS